MGRSAYRTLVGSQRADVLSGTEYGAGPDGVGRDLIHGLGGDDTIRSFSGADTVYGGAGNDLILDREPYGPSFEWGSGGGNFLYGGAGDDRIMNQFNGDPDEMTEFFMSGGSGDDFLLLYSYATGELRGGGGNDRLYLSGTGGVARGGSGNDIVSAVNPDLIGHWYGWDRYSSSYRDTLQGGTGNDRLYCHAANRDTIIFAPGDGRDSIRYLTAERGEDDLPVDRINLKAFDLDMSAEELLDHNAVDLGDRVLLRVGDQGDALVIWGVDIDELAKVLIL